MQGIFRKENTDKALKYGIYRHLPTYEKIIRNLVSFYYENMYPYLKEYLYELLSAGVNRLIVSDIGIMELLNTEFTEFKLTASCVVQIISSSMVDFYKNFNIERVVFPRHISVEDICMIADNFPELEFECFGLCEKCLHDDGNCRSMHSVGAVCLDCWNSVYERINGESISPQMRHELLLNEAKVLNIISEFYSKYQLENFEILVNDFGILEKVNKIPYLKHNLTVRLGRVLDKTYHDGRLNDQEQMRLYRDCKVRWSDDGTWIPEMAKCVLRRYPVNGIDIDIPAIASMCSTKKDDPEYSVGMFVPYSYTTTGGICLMQNIGIPYERKFGSSNKSCQKKCLEYIQKMKKKVIDIHDENPGMNNGHNMKDIVMYRVGNTVYYIRNCNPEAIVTTGNIRRLIFEPKLMI